MGCHVEDFILVFWEVWVLYKHPIDFMNVRGAYTALLDHKYNQIAKEQVDYGSLPNRSAIDMASFTKICSAIKEGKIKPYTVYDDLIMLVNFLAGVRFMLRGRAEHANLSWSNFQISEITSGKYLGCKKLEIVNLQDKCMHVLVTKPNQKRQHRMFRRCRVS